MFDISWPIWPIICQDVSDFEPLWSILNPFQASQSFRCAPFWPLGVLASLPPAPLQSWPLASRPRQCAEDVFNELRAFMSQICACPIIWLQPSVGGLCFLFLTQTLILPSLTHTWSLLSAFYLGHLRTPCFTRPTRLAKSSSMANFTKASLKRNPKWKTLETELESGKLTLASSIARWWTWDRNNWNSRQLCTCAHILLDQSDTSLHMASRCLVLLCDVLCLPVVSITASIVICFIPWVSAASCPYRCFSLVTFCIKRICGRFQANVLGVSDGQTMAIYLWIKIKHTVKPMKFEIQPQQLIDMVVVKSGTTNTVMKRIDPTRHIHTASVWSTTPNMCHLGVHLLVLYREIV